MNPASGRAETAPAAAQPRWEVVALLGLVAGGILLLRGAPLPAWWLLPGLLIVPWAGRWRVTLLLALALCIWMAWQFERASEARWNGEAQTLELRGVIQAPVSRQGSGYRFGFEPEAGPGRLRVAWYRDAPELRAGDCWNLTVRLRSPRGSLNPGGLDYEAWLFREGYAGLASVRAGQRCGSAASSWRDHWRDDLARFSQPRAAATVQALLLGDRSGLGDGDWEVLRRTGTSHLLAISGLHVGLIAGLGYLLGVLAWKVLLYRYLPRSRDCGVVVAALAALGYAALAGFAIPVQRALIMCLLGLLAILSSRRRELIQTLALALVLMLAWNPLVLLAPGFWLSFAAAFAIFWYLRWYPQQGWLRQLLGIQLLLSVLLMPLSLLFFGGLSWLALPVNLLLVPLFGILLPTWVLLCLAYLSLGWDVPMNWVLYSMDWLWLGLSWLADAPWAYRSYAQPSWGLALVAVLGVLLLVPPKWWSRTLAAPCLLVVLCAGADRPAWGEFRLWVWDVGQGQSILLQTAEQDLLYDAGPAWPGGFDAGEQLVAPALHALGVRRLDVLIISHADSDHAGGQRAIERQFPIAQRWGSGARPCIAGMNWRIDGVVFGFVHPPAGNWSDNNGSCVLRVLANSGRAALLTGDIEAAAERVALAGKHSLRADVLLVPHHGSASSSSPDFIQAVQPKLAIASAGFANRWGFPSEPVRHRYAQLEIPLLVSGQTGALRVEVGEALDYTVLRESAPRLWRYPASSR